MSPIHYTNHHNLYASTSKHHPLHENRHSISTREKYTGSSWTAARWASIPISTCPGSTRHEWPGPGYADGWLLLPFAWLTPPFSLPLTHLGTPSVSYSGDYSSTGVSGYGFLVRTPLPTTISTFHQSSWAMLQSEQLLRQGESEPRRQ